MDQGVEFFLLRDGSPHPTSFPSTFAKVNSLISDGGELKQVLPPPGSITCRVLPSPARGSDLCSQQDFTALGTERTSDEEREEIFYFRN